jgi:two-component system chemotaxis response regulator CheY
MCKRALVADDSPTMRRIIVRCLAAVGWPAAVEAASGEEAVSLLTSDRFDLVLSDWNMPGRNGAALIKEIRAYDDTIPIIMVASDAERARAMRALAAEVSDCLFTPFTAAALRQKLEQQRLLSG